MKQTPELETKAQTGPVTGFVSFFRPWRYFFYFLGLACLIGAFYLEENWRGERAWSKHQQQIKASGEPFSRESFVPPEVPDSKNFAMTPLLAPLFEFAPGTQTWADTNAFNRVHNFAPQYDAAASAIPAVKSPRSNSWVAGVDLRAWYAAMLPSTNRPTAKEVEVAMTNFPVSVAAAGVIEALSECEPILDELRAASQRPYQRFNIRYEQEDPASILLPHLAVVKHFCMVLQLRTCAELAIGRVQDAFDDVQLMLYLTDASRDEPTIISQLVRMAELQIALEPIAAGMGQWSDAQLQALQDRLLRFDFVADMKQVIRAERTLFGIGIIEFVRRASNRYTLINQLSPPLGTPGGLMVVAPNGWFSMEQLNLSRAFSDYLIPAIDTERHLIRPADSRRADTQFFALTNHSASVLFLKHRYFAALALPSISTACRKAAFAQSGTEIAAIACALERYRRRAGHMPDCLEALAPEFFTKLPHDIINGQPLRYRRLDPNKYLLYSVGWNETDDNGFIGTLKTQGRETEGPAKSEGDWAWRSE